ncbi:MAG: hypothetical protein HOP11_06635 [Saprospiraceae bacterium]|nr:hypothetical protein [Saprospiraceae bacterium]
MINSRIFKTVAFALFLGININAQDMLDGIDTDPVNEKVLNAFKSTRVINSHSMEMLPFGNLDFRILHRFDYLNSGVENFFGLDNARTMRLGFDYAFMDNLTVGIGRSSFKKEFDAFVRYRILWQSTGKKAMPISLIYTGGIVYDGRKTPFVDTIEATFARRSSYYHQLLIGRKFNERLTVQLAPMILHSNFVTSDVYPNTIFATELGVRYKITNRVAILVDYTMPFNAFPSDFKKHPLSIGVDIETGGHVFQLHLANSNGINERAYIKDDNGNWFNGDIGFGFNISRLFQIQRRKIEN